MILILICQTANTLAKSLIKRQHKKKPKERGKQSQLCIREAQLWLLQQVVCFEYSKTSISTQIGLDWLWIYFYYSVNHMVQSQVGQLTLVVEILFYIRNEYASSLVTKYEMKCHQEHTSIAVYIIIITCVLWWVDIIYDHYGSYKPNAAPLTLRNSDHCYYHSLKR